MPPEAAESVRDLEQSAEHRGAIILRQLDETRLLQQAAELDEVTRAVATLSTPIADAVHGASLEQARDCLLIPPQCPRVGPQLPRERGGT